MGVASVAARRRHGSLRKRTSTARRRTASHHTASHRQPLITCPSVKSSPAQAHKKVALALMMTRIRHGQQQNDNRCPSWQKHRSTGESPGTPCAAVRIGGACRLALVEKQGPLGRLPQVGVGRDSAAGPSGAQHARGFDQRLGRCGRGCSPRGEQRARWPRTRSEQCVKAKTAHRSSAPHDARSK